MVIFMVKENEFKNETLYREESETMLHPEYQNSLNQNYLVFRNVKEETYELRMLMENKIDHLLPLELRLIDGRRDLYYKISSLQAITNVYKNKEMNEKDVRAVLTGLTKAFRSMQEYMLDEKHVMLLPEYIFMKSDGSDIFLLFHPFYEKEAREGLRELADYLIGRIDHTNQEAVMIGYQFYRTVREDHFIIDDIIDLYSRSRKEKVDRGRENEKEIWGSAEQDLIHATDETKQMYEFETAGVKAVCNDPVDQATLETGNEKQSVLKIAVFSILALIGGTVLCFGIGPYQPDRIGRIVLIMMILIAIPGIVIEVRKYHKQKESKEQSVSHEEIPDSMSSKNDYNSIFAGMEPDNMKNEPDYGKTVLLSSDQKIAENILIEKKHGTEKEHPIETFPYTIGKQKDHVNLILNDVSVSRIHARLTTEAGQVYVEDCDSTNGTYVNGVLLEKGEKIPIDIDDEIRIGRITLVYQ